MAVLGEGGGVTLTPVIIVCLVFFDLIVIFNHQMEKYLLIRWLCDGHFHNLQRCINIYVALVNTFGRAVQAAFANVTTPFLRSVPSGGKLSGKFNFGVGTERVVMNQSYMEDWKQLDNYLLQERSTPQKCHSGESWRRAVPAPYEKN